VVLILGNTHIRNNW